MVERIYITPSSTESSTQTKAQYKTARAISIFLLEKQYEHVSPGHSSLHSPKNTTPLTIQLEETSVFKCLNTAMCGSGLWIAWLGII